MTATPRERLTLRAWLLLFPFSIAQNLAKVADAGLVERVPNLWQVQLGVWRMVHRLLFRPETIGTCRTFPVRSTRRARWLAFRPFRFPFLVRERAVAPFDFSGLASPPWRVHRHLLGAHHDGDQFVYDLQMLAIHPGALQRVRDDAKAVVEGTHPRGEFLRDLVVYERYHEQLLLACDAALAGTLHVTPGLEDDPDITFTAYLRWCARQPSTPGETWRAFRAGRFSIAHGLAADPSPSSTPVAA